jgi:hypothetical protein
MRQLAQATLDAWSAPDSDSEQTRKRSPAAGADRTPPSYQRQERALQ